ncbi:Glypican domain containing protein, partial [Asbolus verrucosus]
ALDKVADRLIGPYSIEMVVEPLNIKISEAIMNFQESGTEVSKKIYGFCGKPTLSKRKRDVNSKDDVETNPSLEIQYAPMKMQGHKKKKTKKHEEPSFQKLIKEIKLKVRETRQFWAHLPYQYCNNMTAPLTSDDQCWNGTSLGKYTKSTTTKPPITVSPLVQEQNYTLHILTFKLRRAYDGDEVEIIDDSDDNADGSGSGSGDFEIDDNPEHEFKYSKAEIDKDMEVRNEIPAEAQPLPSTNKPKVTRTYVGGASSISLSRALIQYLLPIVFVWFGGAITDLL